MVEVVGVVEGVVGIVVVVGFAVVVVVGFVGVNVVLIAGVVAEVVVGVVPYSKIMYYFLTNTFTRTEGYLLVMSVENMSAHDAITPPRMINVEKEVKIIIIFGFTIFQRGVNCKDKKNSLQWD